ncbi:MAG: metal ABC transporter permease [Candidatus Omnitrophica bacterium]|nr:metal ABC transporter permease [Candidatus Omnitrophota bacterium]
MDIIQNLFSQLIFEGNDYSSLVCVIVAALSCSILSSFAAVKRMTLAGVGIGGAIFSGAAAGLLLFPTLGVYDWPIQAAAAAGGLIAALLGLAFQSNRVLPSESAYGVLIVSLLGFLLIAYGEWGARLSVLNAYLLDSPPALSMTDFYLVIGLSAAVVLIVLLFHRGFAALCIDPDFARAIGVSIRFFDILLWLLLLGTLLISIYATGFLFTLSLILFPGLCARMMAVQMGRIVVWSAFLGVATGFTAEILSQRFFDLPASIILIIIHVSVFVLLYGVNRWNAARTMRLPSQA